LALLAKRTLTFAILENACGGLNIVPAAPRTSPLSNGHTIIMSSQPCE